MKTLHLAVIVILSSVIAANVGIAFADEGPVSMGPGPVQNSSKRIDIPVTFAPLSVAVNPVTNMIYVAHTSLADSVSVISGKTNKTISEIKVGKDPALVKVNPVTNMIYVTDTNSHSVSVISGLTNKVVDTVQVGGFPRDILINTGTNTIYIASEDSNTISVIDGKTNTVVATIPVCNISGAESTFAIDQTENTIYVTCTGPDGAIDVISGTTNKVVDTIPIGLDPTNVVFNPQTHMLYTANNGDYTVSVVSAKTDKVIDTIPVAVFPNVIAVNPVTNMIYVASSGNGSGKNLSIISGETNKVTATATVSSSVYNIAIDSSNNIIYTVNYASNSISVISGKTNTLIDTIPVGALPTSIAINDITKTVYVANWRSDFVSMIPITSLDLQNTEARAGNSNNVYIQDIQVTPSTIKVGEAFTVSATLVNNSTFPIFVDGGKCSAQDTQAELFTITLDNHVKNKAENILCAGVGWSPLLDPGKSITGTTDYTVNYVATESGTATITVTFSYHSLVQEDPIQTSAEQKVSKSLQFQIRDVNSDSSGPPIPVPGIPSPLQQFRSGIESKDVKCKEGLVLAIKNDGMPICVKPTTVDKLYERGILQVGTIVQTVGSHCNSEFIPKPFELRVLSNGTSITVNYTPVFLMKPNSTGKICTNNWRTVSGTNYSGKVTAGIGRDDSATRDVTVAAYPDTITIDNTNKTIVYTITSSKNSSGFYRFSPMFSNCGGIPIAIGYNSTHSFDNDFPWLWDTVPCPLPFANTEITGLTGIDVAYITKEYR